jgi:hypothetical protein
MSTLSSSPSTSAAAASQTVVNPITSNKRWNPRSTIWRKRFRRFAGMAWTGPLCRKLEAE